MDPGQTMAKTSTTGPEADPQPSGSAEFAKPTEVTPMELAKRRESKVLAKADSLLIAQEM